MGKQSVHNFQVKQDDDAPKKREKGRSCSLRTETSLLRHFRTTAVFGEGRGGGAFSSEMNENIPLVLTQRRNLSASLRQPLMRRQQPDFVLPVTENCTRGRSILEPNMTKEPAEVTGEKQQASIPVVVWLSNLIRSSAFSGGEPATGRDLSIHPSPMQNCSF